MLKKLSLDIQDIESSLRDTPRMDNGIWDPLNTTLSGDSYIRIDSGFVFGILDLDIFQPFQSKIIRREYVTIQFRKSYIMYNHSYNGQVAQVRSGVTLTAIPASVTEIRKVPLAEAMKSAGTAVIHIARDYLVDSFGLRPEFWREEYRDAFLNKESPSLYLGVPLTPEMWIVLDAILGCKFNEPVRTHYLRAKAIELLSLAVVQFNSFDLPGGAASLEPGAQDRRLVEIAAMIYQRELSHPPSVEEMGRRVGLNRNKLTSGFRLAFGKTPAEYSREVRLKWAARRLSEGATIRRAAAEAGYESVPAFGRAFREQFGYIPSEHRLLGR